jgi:hypothetical protein
MGFLGSWICLAVLQYNKNSFSPSNLARGGAAYYAWAENCRMSLKGMREGLAEARANPYMFAGVTGSTGGKHGRARDPKRP